MSQTCDCSILIHNRLDMTGNSCNRSTTIKYMLPKYRHLQSTRGLKHKIPPSTAIAYTILHQSTRGLKHKIPPSTAIAYAILHKSTRGLKRKIPPSTAIAFAILHKSTRGLKHKFPLSSAI